MKKQLLLVVTIVIIVVGCDIQNSVNSTNNKRELAPTNELTAKNKRESTLEIQSMQSLWTDTYVCSEPSADGNININFSAHTTPISVTESMSRGDVIQSIISGINNDSNAHISASGGGGNRIVFQQISGSGTYVYITPWSSVDPNGDMFSEYQPEMGQSSAGCN